MSFSYSTVPSPPIFGKRQQQGVTPNDGDIAVYRVSSDRFEPEAQSGGGAPTDAFYLVTQANGDLDNEVVVTAYPFEAGDLATDSVTISKIAASAVSTSKIQDNAVTTPKIMDADVTSVKIANLAVIEARLGQNAVTAQKLQTDAVTSIKIQANAVTKAKLATGLIPLEVLGDYEAASAESSHNFNFTAVDFDDDSELILIIDIGVTGALNLQIRINGDAGNNYFMDGRRISGGSETILDQNSTSEPQIASSTLLSTANREAFIVVHIGLAKAGDLDRTAIIYDTQAIGNAMNEAGGIQNTTARSSITDVLVRTSTNTWQIGTRMTLYKVPRS